MKKHYLVLMVFLVFAASYGQSKKLESITEFKLRNSGAILDKEKNVTGYYFFYLIDNLKKGEAEYGIQILDHNLNEIAFKKYISERGDVLIDSKFNNEALAFVFTNKKEENLKLVLFDKNAEQKSTKTIELTKKESMWMNAMNQQSEDYNILTPIPNQGFLLSTIKDNKKIGYSLKFFPSNDAKAWSFNSPEEAKELLFASPIAVNENYIIVGEMSKPGMLSNKIAYTTKIINAQTGKLVTAIKEDIAKPKLITNALLNEKNEVVLMGEYFKENDNILKDDSQGLYIQTMDAGGNIIEESFSSWEKQISPKIKEGDDDKNYYIYFHDIIPMPDGGYYAIGEKYKKTASAGGIAMAVLTKGGSPTTQLTITDALIFEFDNAFSLKNITRFEKGKSRAPSVTDFGSPQLNARILNSLGAFDYIYTQVDKANNRFYACFTDYERLKGEKNKTAFKTIIYDEGEFSQDKIYLDEKGKTVRVLPAKIGHVVIMEYSKKEKSLDLHLEKLNIN